MEGGEEGGGRTKPEETGGAEERGGRSGGVVREELEGEVAEVCGWRGGVGVEGGPEVEGVGSGGGER